jgi:predicted RNase H-like HicB family nuclease
MVVPIIAMTLYSYPITIEREGKQYYAYSEDFPGVYGLGKTIEKAKASLLQGMRLYITQCLKSRKPIPPTRTVYAETVTLAFE